MTVLNVHADTAAGARRRITFHSEGTELVGDLRLPGASLGQRWPAVVLTGPFTGVKEQVTGSYAELLSASGLVTLAFDHRGFGESGGRRQHEDSQGKLADLRAAVSVLGAQAEVDPARIGLGGICLGGGYAIRAAAADPRVKAVAGIAGGYNSPSQMVQSMGIGGYRAALSAALERYDEHMPAVAPGGGEAAMGGDEPYAYYGTPRSRSPYWRNEVTRGSLHSLMTFDALSAADLLAETPLLIIHGERDAYCSPELARALYGRKPGDKEILWLDASLHTDLYDNMPYVSQAAEAAAAFLHRRLSALRKGDRRDCPDLHPRSGQVNPRRRLARWGDGGRVTVLGPGLWIPRPRLRRWGEGRSGSPTGAGRCPDGIGTKPPRGSSGPFRRRLPAGRGSPARRWRRPVRRWTESRLRFFSVNGRPAGALGHNATSSVDA